MKIRPVGAVLFLADRLTDRRTDMTKRIVVFRNFANVSKNGFRFLSVPNFYVIFMCMCVCVCVCVCARARGLYSEAVCF